MDAFIMRVLLLLRFGFVAVSAETHSLQYFYTGARGINFPQFTVVGMVDGGQAEYYDSNIRKVIPKTEWMKKVDVDDPDYWNRNTQIAQGAEEIFKVDVATAMERFNQTEGVHVLQRMYGCELDDDGSTRGYDQYGYDGEDFISLDLNTGTWTAANAKAVITKIKWEATGDAKYWKNYLENTCISWLKKYISYGREFLERRVPPEVSVFQKISPRSELVCHATGFYPRGVMMFWEKDGEEVNEDVEIRETLPNQDGSFQKRAILRVSPEEQQKHRYTCVVQHSSLEEDLVIDAHEARDLSGSAGPPLGIIVGVCVAVLGVGVAVLALIGGVLIWKKKNSAECSSSTSSVSSDDSDIYLNKKR